MTSCSHFSRTVDSWLAGDVDQTRRIRLERHAKTCPVCQPAWGRVRRIAGVLNQVSAETAAVVTEESITATRDRLRAVFSLAKLPPVRFSSLRTPIGVVFFGVSDHGLCDVALGLRYDAEYRARLATRAPEVWRDDRALQSVRAELESYFAGMRQRFSIPTDLRAVTPFVARVLRAARRVPFGRLTSYGAIADRLGARGASRAVGNALGSNPIPIVIPCHRVVRGTGSLGGYTGGVGRKRSLLQLEGHRVTSRGRPARIVP